MPKNLSGGLCSIRVCCDIWFLFKVILMPIDGVSAYSTNVTLFKYSSGQDASPAPKKKENTGLSDEDQKKVKELEKRDQVVRTHEAAHIAAGGQYVKGGATYQYQKGPDGKMYAVGGEVSIDTSPVKGDPQATVAKMETIKAAALAPADPSGQDRAVAAEASQEEAQARQEEAQQSTSGGKGASGKTESPKTSTYNNKGIALLGASQKGNDQNGIAQKSIAAVNDIQKSIVNMMA
jgi:SprA-related family